MLRLFVCLVFVSYCIDFYLIFLILLQKSLQMNGRDTIYIHKTRSLEFLSLWRHSKMAFQIAIEMAWPQLNFPLNGLKNSCRFHHQLTQESCNLGILKWKETMWTYMLMFLLKNVHDLQSHILCERPTRLLCFLIHSFTDSSGFHWLVVYFFCLVSLVVYFVCLFMFWGVAEFMLLFLWFWLVISIY